VQIGDVEIPGGRNGQGHQVAELLFLEVRDALQQIEPAVEPLNAPVARIRHVDLQGIPGIDVRGTIELIRVPSESADLVQKSPVFVEPLDTVVARIRHVHGAQPIHGDSMRIDKRSGAASEPAEAQQKTEGDRPLLLRASSCSGHAPSGRCAAMRKEESEDEETQKKSIRIVSCHFWDWSLVSGD